MWVFRLFEYGSGGKHLSIGKKAVIVIKRMIRLLGGK